MDNIHGLFLWGLILIVTVLIGGFSFYYAKGRKAIFLSAVISWSLFLILNLYLEYHSQDKEVMKGSWISFQIILGSFVAVMSVVSGWVVSRFIDRKTRV